MTPTRTVYSTLALVALLLAGCDTDHTAELAAPAGSSVKILATDPDHSETLTAGDLVKLRVETEYQLNTESGTLSLVVQESDTSTISVNTEVLTRGKGKIVFEVEFTVPHTKAVLLFTPLTAQGQTATSTVDTLAFKVEVDDSKELDLEKAALIDADYCAIAGVAIGSTYRDVVSVFGQPADESVIGGDSDESDGIVRFLDYEGVSVGLKSNSVIVVSSEHPEYRIHGNIGPTSTRDEVVKAFGETVGLTGESREVLAYRCRDIRSAEGAVMVAVIIVDDAVEAVSVVVGDEN